MNLRTKPKGLLYSFSPEPTAPVDFTSFVPANRIRHNDLFAVAVGSGLNENRPAFAY
jgi:hypothetical protein